MSKKVLFTSSTKSHFDHFHLPYFKAFETLGWEVTPFVLPVSKSFFSSKNLAAIYKTRKLIKQERFDFISSQSTLAGIVTRLAVMLTGKQRKSMKVFHTAHGYLFHDDRSLKKWGYLLPEMICSRVTDVLMVMNHEDLDIAKKYKLCGKKNQIYFINGMGIDIARFRPKQAVPEQKKAFGISDRDFTFVYAAEFSKRKNHSLLLKAFAEALNRLRNNSGSHCGEKSGEGRIKLALAGDGILLEEMKALSKELGISENVLFLGYVKNIHELYTCCQAAVSTSRIEGLPFNIMEALSCSLPVIASDIKGHRELIIHQKNGLLFESENQEQLVCLLLELYQNTELREGCRSTAFQSIEPFSIEKVLPSIMEIYQKHI